MSSGEYDAYVGRPVYRPSKDTDTMTVAHDHKNDPARVASMTSDDGRAICTCGHYRDVHSSVATDHCVVLGCICTAFTLDDPGDANDQTADAPDDPVNHPSHYNSHPSGVECIDIVEHMPYNIGNAIKYLWRADAKGNAIEDLRKAAWYVAREIALRERCALADQLADALLKQPEGKPHSNERDALDARFTDNLLKELDKTKESNKDNE